MTAFSRTRGKTIGFGLLLFVVWQLSSFIAALATGTQGENAADVDFNSMPLVISGLIVALLLGAVAYWLCRMLRLDAKRDALMTGAWWVVILVLLQILTTIPYQTTSVLFSAWAMYLPYLAILTGAAYGAPKNPARNQPAP